MTRPLTVDQSCWACILFPWAGDTRATFVARLVANHWWSGGNHVRLKAGEPLQLPKSPPSEDVVRRPYWYGGFRRTAS